MMKLKKNSALPFVVFAKILLFAGCVDESCSFPSDSDVIYEVNKNNYNPDESEDFTLTLHFFAEQGEVYFYSDLLLSSDVYLEYYSDSTGGWTQLEPEYNADFRERTSPEALREALPEKFSLSSRDPIEIVFTGSIEKKQDEIRLVFNEIGEFYLPPDISLVEMRFELHPFTRCNDSDGIPYQTSFQLRI